MSEAYHDYLKSEYWQAVSKAVKGRAGWRCQLCNSQHDLCAHHRTYDHRGKELDHLDDLVCLCRRCHEIFHGKSKALAVVEPTVAVKETAYSKHKKKMKAKIDQYAYNHLADMPEGVDDITLTLDLINRTRTGAYGFTNATLRVLGVKRPLLKGWVFRMVGIVITRKQYLEALKGREYYNSGGLDRNGD